MATKPFLEEFDPDRATNRGVTFFFGLSLIIFVIQIVIVYFLLTGQIEIIVFLVIHFFIAGLLGVTALAYNWLLWDLRFPLLGLAVVSVGGPFGALLIILAMIYYLGSSRHAVNFAEWLEGIFPRLYSVEGTIYERIVSDWDDFSDKINLIPYADVMAFGKLNEKMIALVKVATNYDPQFAHVLREGLHDSSISVRVQAASIIAKFERDYANNLSLLQKKLKRRPNDPNALYELATLCDHNSELGIFDEERTAHMRELAVDSFEKYRKLAGKGFNIEYRLGWLYTRMGDAKKGRELIESYMKNVKATPPVIHHYLATLFMARDYTSLRRYARKNYDSIKGEEANSSGVLEVLLLWKDGIDFGDPQTLIPH